MAFANFDSKEISAKVLVAGPKGVGKSETLRSFYRQTSEEMESGDRGFVDKSSHTPFFEFLPVSAGYFRGFHLKLHLYTLPAEAVFPTTVGLILRGLDACIFVADSRLIMAAENLSSWQYTRDMLTQAGISLDDLGWVLQYNRRDATSVISAQAMQEHFHHHSCVAVETIAHQDKGTLEVLQAVGRLVISRLGHGPEPQAQIQHLEPERSPK